MVNYIAIVGGVLSLIYGFLLMIAGRGEYKERRIQVWASLGTTLSGLIILTSAVILFIGSYLSLYILLVGLVMMHLLAINNGYQLYGGLKPSHHISRLLISITLGLLYYFS
jgi:hypothetical protein